LVVDKIGYLSVVLGGSNLFVQFVNACYDRGGNDPHREIFRKGSSAIAVIASSHGPVVAPRHRQPDQRLKLSLAAACRPGSRARSMEGPHHAATGVKMPRPPAKG
jgi:hypothetical protein